MLDFPQLLKTFRAKMNISQEELGEMLGLSSRSIQDYERGVTIPLWL